MFKTNHHLTVALALLLLATAATAQTKYEFSSKQSIDYANKNNVQVKNALLDLQIQKQTNRDITSAALPNLSANGSILDNLKIATQLLPGEFFGQPAGSFVPVRFGTKYNVNAGFELKQLLFDGQVFVGLQARKYSLDFQQKNIEVTTQAINVNIYKIYYQLVVGKTQIELLTANIERLKKLDHDTREIYKNGFAEKIDVDKIAVQLVNLETEKLKVQNQIDAGYFGLKLLMGMPIKDTLILTETITDEKIKNGLDADTAYQYANRKEFQYLDLARKLGEYNIKRYKLSALPTLSLSSAFSYSAQRNTFDIIQKSGNWFPSANVSVRLAVPIFDGFSRASKVQKARLELQQTNNNLSNLKLSIDNDVATAKINMQSAVLALNFQKKNMVLAEDVYNQTKKKYEAGTGSNTEITNAQTELKQAQTNYINSLYDAIIARIDYMKAIGKLEQL